MIDINRHRFYLFQLLKEIYSDKYLAGKLAFKGGTALMFFYDLPRFSVDLDFNLTDPAKEKEVYRQLRKMVLKYGTIHDEAIKFYGIICVLDYGKGERKLKIEVSNRNYDDRYELKNLFGVNVRVMVKQDMFAHKLCALLDRTSLTNRDIFDCWFFMQNKTPINANLVEQRMHKPLKDYLQDCITALKQQNDRKMLNGLGEVMDKGMKDFVRTELLQETINWLEFYRTFPLADSGEHSLSNPGNS